MRPTAPGRARLPRPTSVLPAGRVAGSSGPSLRPRRRRGTTVLVAAAVAAVALGSTLPAYAGPGGHRAKPGGATTVASWTTPAQVSAGAPVRTSAVVASPGTDGGRKVTLQRQSGGSWSTLDRATTDARGRAVLDWKAPSTATSLVLRVSVARSGAKRAAVSSTRRVSVATSAPTTTGDAVLDRTLALVNAARAQARSCGGKQYSATTPLRPEGRLARAADGWARRMATERFFAHEWAGSDPQSRIDATGYRWTTWGENIAAGQPTPEAVVAAWLTSPGHCQAIMNPAFSEVGVGHVVVQGSPYGHYWVTNFGHPR